MNELKQTFINNLLKESVNKTFDDAKLEWKLYKLHYTYKNGLSCICNKLHIKKLCYIQNLINEKILLVGSDCIIRFLKHIQVNFYFNGIHQLKVDGIPNPTFIEYLYKKKIINEYEYTFYINRYKQKKSTEKQNNFKKRLNKQILNKIEFNKKW